VNWNSFYTKASAWVVTMAPKVLFGLVIVALGLWLISLLKKWLTNHLLKKQVNSSVRPFLVNLSIVTLQILLGLAFMQIVGIQMTAFAALLGAFGVAAGLALSGTLQNFTSGVLILLLKPFRIGDNIIAQGQEGTVYTIQIFFTIIKTYDNRTVIMPNSKLSNEVIVNLSREGKRRVDIELKFPFSADFNQVKGLLEQSINAESGLLKDPVHRIGVSDLEPDGYKVLVSAWVAAHGYVDAKLLLQQRIIGDLKGKGIGSF
jgi:small conductance mechanosensitive channel